MDFHFVKCRLTNFRVWRKIRYMRRFVFVLKVLLVLAMLAFIWGQSLMPGAASQMESDSVLKLVYPVVELLQKALAALGRTYDPTFLVRKLAHFTEYAVLGVLMFVLFLQPEGGGRYIPPMGLCLAAAAVDEGLQFFAVDRGPALRDVILDFTGSCAGILAAGLCVVVLQGLRRRTT